MTKFIHHFEAADFEDKELLGGKGAGLARMTQQGYPVPYGFTIDTTACAKFLAGELDWFEFTNELYDAIGKLAFKTGLAFGDHGSSFPLLVSVRSGASVSMPGMMETVLNTGITSKSLPRMGNPRFSLPLYCDFLGVYGRLVLGQNSRRLESPATYYKEQRSLEAGHELTRTQLEEMVVLTRARAIRDRDELDLSSAHNQLEKSIKAVFNSSCGPKAMAYKKHNGIPLDMGTAVSIVAMVYGNRNEQSGTGALFTRNPSTGVMELYGEYVPMSQGESLVSGAVTPFSLDYLKTNMPEVYAQLYELAYRLEADQCAPQDIEFTVDSGTLWLLQHRDAHMTSYAKLVSRVDMAHEGLITEEEAAIRVEPSTLKYADMPTFKTGGAKRIGAGLAASPGLATGRASISGVYDPKFNWADDGIILIRTMTSPEDVPAMLAARALLTGVGGTTSHAAVVARSEDIPCVVGIGEWAIDNYCVTLNGESIIHDGDLISVDGASGEIYLGILEQAGMSDSGPTTYVETMTGWHKKFGVVKKTSKKKLTIGLAHVSAANEDDMQSPKAIEKQIAHWWPELDLKLDLTRIAADFYLLSEATRVNPELKGAMDSYSETLAKEIAVYLDAVCGGELRHKKNGYPGLTAEDRGLARREWRIERKARGLQAVTIMTETFNNSGNWTSKSYGGPRWGQASGLLEKFLGGEMRAATFIDMTFDLQHNGGCIFNKLVYTSILGFGWNLDNLKPVLDWKLKGDFKKLLKAGSKEMQALFAAREQLNDNSVTVTDAVDADGVWVQGTEASDVALVEGSMAVIGIGVKSMDLRGRSIKVKRLRELKRDGQSVGMFAYFDLDGRERYAAVKNMTCQVYSETTCRSYFDG